MLFFRFVYLSLLKNASYRGFPHKIPCLGSALR